MNNNIEKIYYLTYFSTSRRKFSEEELKSLLKKARTYNTQYGVTGMLMYYDGNFVQAIEGSQESVSHVFDRISKDNRHYQIIMMKEGYAEKRVFNNWSMAFHIFRNEEFLDQDGFLNFVYKDIFDDESMDITNPIIIVLKSFFEAQPIYRRLYS